jgi:hypothetical protein
LLWRAGMKRTLLAIFLLFGASRAHAFGLQPHTDLTRDALAAEGFGETAIKVVQVNNWFNDLYETLDGIYDKARPYINVLFPITALLPSDSPLRRASQNIHFDSSNGIVDSQAVEREFRRLARATRDVLRERAQYNDIPGILTVMGISLHAVQDFYAHTNWTEALPGPNPDAANWSSGPGWAALGTWGSHPTFFDVPEAQRSARGQIYSSKGTCGPNTTRSHGEWDTDNSVNLKVGMNKDQSGRPFFREAYTTANFATRQWIRAMRQWLGNETLWAGARAYSDTHGADLGRDQRAMFRLEFYSGSWSGNKSDGHDYLMLADAFLEYFSMPDVSTTPSPKTFFRSKWESLITRVADTTNPPERCPAGTSTILPVQALPPPGPLGEPVVASSMPIQRETDLVAVKVNRLHTPSGTFSEDSDWYVEGDILGQHFHSGLFGNHNTVDFSIRPRAPFTFIKSVPRNGTFSTRVATFEVQLRTADADDAGTDDDVFVRINDTRRFEIPYSPSFDDFERGRSDWYAFDPGTLRVSDIRYIRIEKPSNDSAWFLRGITVRINDRVVYNRDFNVWLNGTRRSFEIGLAELSLPPATTTEVPIRLETWDLDYFIRGADDHYDINPDRSLRDLRLLYNRATGGYRGDTFGTTVGTSGGNGGTEIDFRVDTIRTTPAPAVLTPFEPIVIDTVR